jgi:hypothetical protein
MIQFNSGSYKGERLIVRGSYSYQGGTLLPHAMMPKPHSLSPQEDWKLNTRLSSPTKSAFLVAELYELNVSLLLPFMATIFLGGKYNCAILDSGDFSGISDMLVSTDSEFLCRK